MEMSKKKELIVFLLVAYGVTYLMGIVMYLGMKKGVDLNALALAQMTYPAAGVILAKLLYGDKDKPIPKAAFICYLIFTGISMLIGILSVALPLEPLQVLGQSVDIYYSYAQVVLVIFSIVIYILFWVCGKEKRMNAGMCHPNVGLSIGLVVLFLGLYIFRVFLGVGIDQVLAGEGANELKALGETMTSLQTWAVILMLPISFFLAFLCFFGEEYGWRYYFQGILQEKFGLRGGVLLLGLLWGLWHLPMDLCFYTTTTGAQMVCTQIITCTAYAIFFGYVYMKTQNMWAPIVIHFLNNNLIPVITGNYKSDVLQNQEVSWAQIPLLFVMMIAYMLFIFAKEYRKKEA